MGSSGHAPYTNQLAGCDVGAATVVLQHTSFGLLCINRVTQGAPSTAEDQGLFIHCDIYDVRDSDNRVKLLIGYESLLIYIVYQNKHLLGDPC